MRLSYHPSVQKDVNEILEYYQQAGGEGLAERFYSELATHLKALSEHPERCPFYLGTPPFRRMRLRRFPHIIVFRILRDRLRITVIKHEKRHPAFGMRRQ
jgi:plasmid stabilization system protein ParE